MRFQGEMIDLEQAVLIGKKWGYGNLIAHLKEAWSKDLQENYGMSKATADRGSLQFCVWCGVHADTGKPGCDPKLAAEGKCPCGGA